MIFTGTKVIKIAFQLPSRAIAIRNLHESQIPAVFWQGLNDFITAQIIPRSFGIQVHHRSPKDRLAEEGHHPDWKFSLHLFSIYKSITAEPQFFVLHHRFQSTSLGVIPTLVGQNPQWCCPGSFHSVCGAQTLQITQSSLQQSPTCRASTMKVSQCCFKLPGSVHWESLGDDFPTKLESDCHT
jgi:hypothetical protein